MHCDIYPVMAGSGRPCGRRHRGLHCRYTGGLSLGKFRVARGAIYPTQAEAAPHIRANLHAVNNADGTGDSADGIGDVPVFGDDGLCFQQFRRLGQKMLDRRSDTDDGVLDRQSNPQPFPAAAEPISR